MEAAPHPWPALGTLLLRDGLVEESELEALLEEQRESRHPRMSGWRLGELLVQRGAVTQAQVAKLVAEQYELPYLELDPDDVERELAERLPEELVTRFSALPIEILSDGSTLVAVSDPGSVLFSDELRRALGTPLRFAVVAPDAMESAIASVRAGARVPERASVERLWPVDDPLADLLVHTAPAEVVEDTYEPTLEASAERPQRIWPPLGTLLVRDGFVSEDELEAALAQQRLSPDKRLGEILVERGSVTRSAIARVVAEQYELPFLELANEELDPRVAALLEAEIADRYAALPLRFEPDGSLLVVVADPTKVLDREELCAALGSRLSFAVADPQAIESAALRVRRQSAVESRMEPAQPEPFPTLDPTAELTHEPTPNPAAAEREPAAPASGEPFPYGLALPEDPLLLESEQPAVEDASDAEADADEPRDDDAEQALARFEWDVDVELDFFDGAEQAGTVETPAPSEVVEEAHAPPTEAEEYEEHEDHPSPRGAAVDELVDDALAVGASSIHFSAQEDGLHVRARVDGELRMLATIAGDERPSAELALAELADARSGLDVTLVPTWHGTTATLRRRDEHATGRSLDDLHLENEEADALRAALAQGTGLVLVAGRLGSGRSTTLHAALAATLDPARLHVTVEEHVHRLVPGIDQVVVDGDTSGALAAALRSALACDPDVVLVDELRDSESARVAVDAAASRLVLAAVRADSAVDAIDRLVALGVPAEALATTLAAVVEQRLARRICMRCRQGYYATSEELSDLGRPDEQAGQRLLGRGTGCPSCRGTGLDGHIALAALLPLTDELRTLLAADAPAAELGRAARARGGRTVLEAGIRLCLDGITTAAEVRRVAL